mmetsp:Transcript_98547/g.177945  ORF Transcript_98547/g.177945 Transcript_98547/m.177945 type:complete len:263 (+) Transcript_98547:196-984(+)
MIAFKFPEQLQRSAFHLCSCCEGGRCCTRPVHDEGRVCFGSHRNGAILLFPEHVLGVALPTSLLDEWDLREKTPHISKTKRPIGQWLEREIRIPSIEEALQGNLLVLSTEEELPELVQELPVQRTRHPELWSSNSSFGRLAQILHARQEFLHLLRLFHLDLHPVPTSGQNDARDVNQKIPKLLVSMRLVRKLLPASHLVQVVQLGEQQCPFCQHLVLEAFDEGRLLFQDAQGLGLRRGFVAVRLSLDQLLSRVLCVQCVVGV